MFPWWLLQDVNKGMKSGITLPSSQLRDLVLAALLQECSLLEHRTQRRISELRSVCSQFFPNLGFAVLGTFSYFVKGLVTAQQQILQRTWVAFALSIVLYVHTEPVFYACQSFFERTVSARTLMLGVPPSIVDGERVSVAKKLHTSADGLATAQQQILQRSKVGGPCHQCCVCESCKSSTHCQSFFERVLSARTLGVPPSVVDRECKSVHGQEIACTATLEWWDERKNAQDEWFWHFEDFVSKLLTFL